MITKLKWVSNTPINQKDDVTFGTEKYTNYLKWRNKFIKGPPMATKDYTQKELENMGMCGLYRKEKILRRSK